MAELDARQAMEAAMLSISCATCVKTPAMTAVLCMQRGCRQWIS